MTVCVIYDTEFTAWQGSRERGWSEPWEFRELIQIAAVKVEADSNGCAIMASFNEFIKPLRNPQLSEYIVELTGITQDLIDQYAVDLQSGVALFHLFCDEGRCHTLSWGDDQKILAENAALQSIALPVGWDRHTDLSQHFHQIEGYDFHVCSGDLHKVLDLAVTGHAHNALHDVHSIAASLDFLIRKGLIDPATLLE